MSRKLFSGAAVALALGFAVSLSGALPASAVTIDTGGKSCSSGYDAYTWGRGTTEFTHYQTNGGTTVHLYQWVGYSPGTYGARSYGWQSFSASKVIASATLDSAGTGCA